jgi:NAD(P)-dependent dehydrogenase (short-subunit alcohol dehydrogenase family)
MFALPTGETPDLVDDPEFAEMVADPKGRRVLITDGRSPVGIAAAQEMLNSGAQRVFVGISQTWKPFRDLNDLVTAGAETVALDVTDDDSVRRAAASIGGQVDILVNTADCVRPGGIVGVSGQDHRLLTETVHFGLVRLARNFGLAMAGRGADLPIAAVAWVNVLSVFALAGSVRYGAYSAASAAALAAARSLRSELGASGIRVINLFTGPTESEWFQEMPPPKVSARQIARTVLTALREGLEEAAVGDVAGEIIERFYSNPKEAERMADRSWRPS